MDEIRIENLKIYAYHGVYDFEREKGQNFWVNAVLFLDLQKSGCTDDLEKSISYAMVADDMEQFMTQNRFQLIEAAAEHLAQWLLQKYELLKSIQLEIRKPEAPLSQEFESVSVRIHRGWHQAVIAFGSNKGNSEEIILNALQDMKENEKCRGIKTSSIIRTTPYGGVEQDDFYNGALWLETVYEPVELLDYLHELENKYGRTREIHWGPRTLDLDIIFYDDMVMNTETLTIPHPDMENRDFVILPVREVAPFYRHPISGKTMKQLAENLQEKHIIVKEENIHT